MPTTPGAYDTSQNGAYDVFVTKLSSDGGTLLYSTYLGGSDEDIGTGIAVDSAGNAYITGHTYSTDFPTTPGASDTTLNGGRDGFVAKLNAAGNGLVYSTYLGGEVGTMGKASRWTTAVAPTSEVLRMAAFLSLPARRRRSLAAWAMAS